MSNSVQRSSYSLFMVISAIAKLDRGCKLGFKVIGDEVTVDHIINDYAITEIADNPVFEDLNGFKVYSAFRRTRTKRKGSGNKGDNCPLIYALKGLEDLTVKRSTISQLVPNFRSILERFSSHTACQWDLIVCVPSSSPIGHIIAKRVARATTSWEGIIAVDALQKTTIWDARVQLNTLSDIAKGDKSTLFNNLKFQRAKNNDDWTAPYSLKTVPTKLRHYLRTLKHQKSYKSLNPKNILIVDDIVSSGTSLTQAHALIAAKYPNAEITGFTLFSSSSRGVRGI
ncbi:phosphoribosyltransferase family protein [Thalassolituus alkanivorans]|uniref:phosphoribosyltransferase family protein n=1 Tax=Thalassolituus alkanivorans TaxID=2881055 RepID=UPI001E3CF9D6|nr:phosphoribosyltransferase family protein [Thalassolituus alkanivorans]MCB2386364.1 hypothetical protein [Thalassolituus alkanivorans]MCB2422111.1 hypothetical protein [Thalassolituus alkanivorans]